MAIKIQFYNIAPEGAILHTEAPVVPWPSWLRHRANNAGISGSIPLGTISSFSVFFHFVASGCDVQRSQSDAKQVAM